MTDGKGLTATKTVPVVVGNPPGNQAPTVRIAADPKTGTGPLTVTFSSQARDPEGARHAARVGRSVTAGSRRRGHRDAHLHHAGHLHGQADGDRLRAA